MISCSYNGWTDLAEEEREAMEAFEASLTPPALALVRLPLILAARSEPTRKAA